MDSMAHRGDWMDSELKHLCRCMLNHLPDAILSQTRENEDVKPGNHSFLGLYLVLYGKLWKVCH
jgi:hypothetical protein